MDSKTYINDLTSPCGRSFSEMTLIRKFPARAPNEEEISRISDVVVLECDVILVADSTHCVIKAFNMDGDFLSSSEMLDNHLEGELEQKDALFGPMHSVFSMTVIDKTSVAVTLPGSNKFATVLLTPEKKFFVRFTKEGTFHKYWCLASLPGRRYISNAGNLIDVMTLDFVPVGRLTSEFDFLLPSCIAVSGNGNVVIADAGKQCIVVVGNDGYIRHQLHLGIDSLRGIDLDGDNIFFLSSKQNDLFYFSTKGEVIHVGRTKHVQDQLEMPVAIRYLGNGDVIIGEEGGSVKMYHLDNYYRPTQWLTRWRNIRRFCLASLPWRQINEMIGFQGLLELLIVTLLPVSKTHLTKFNEH